MKIYRCWLLWGRHLLVLSIPLVLAWLSFGKKKFNSLLAIVFHSTGWAFLLGVSLAMIGALVEPSSSLRIPGAFLGWFFPLSTAAFSASIAVNAIVAILLAVKIFELQQIARKSLTVQKKKVHPIRAFISILNDSGMLMLGCQIIWLALFRLNNIGYVLVRGPIVMIYVRIKMFLPPPLFIFIQSCY